MKILIKNGTIVDGTGVDRYESDLLIENNVIEKNIPISDLRDKILNTDGVESVVFDGIITQRLLDIAVSRGIQHIVGARQHDITKAPLDVKIYTFSD